MVANICLKYYYLKGDCSRRMKISAMKNSHQKLSDITLSLSQLEGAEQIICSLEQKTSFAEEIHIFLKMRGRLQKAYNLYDAKHFVCRLHCFKANNTRRPRSCWTS